MHAPGLGAGDLILSLQLVLVIGLISDPTVCSTQQPPHTHYRAPALGPALYNK